MPERDWSKELAKIDKQLESVSDEALFPSKPAASSASPAARAAASASVAEQRRTTSSLPAVARLALSVLLGAAIVFWPYESRCGVGLAGYLAAVGVVAASGVWSAVWTWRHRTGRAHTLSLLVILWGLVLGAMEVLPRTGYGRPDARHPATWSCEAPPARPTP